MVTGESARSPARPIATCRTRTSGGSRNFGRERVDVLGYTRASAISGGAADAYLGIGETLAGYLLVPCQATFAAFPAASPAARCVLVLESAGGCLRPAA
jgi:hypothetical protein